ncbi:Helicase SEN1 [Escovopsis weberi]|uniref:Helicase SEN1 n=1 Tax=Escovopsis weberi TaxID=150374 RepID=A0A0M8MW76_ESCWE|nr:Helicase SEN1 [Escovopsis weberi]
MAEVEEVLVEWFDRYQGLHVDHHLLCPRISDDDDENYKSLDDPESAITVDEKKARIQNADERIKITYWNSLIFGFDKEHAGKWLNDYTGRLEKCLRGCPDCVLNWHMKRAQYMRQFSEKWNEDVVYQMQTLLDERDVARIGQNINWAQQFIEKIEASGATFKKSLFGEHLGEVHIAVYEALCCIAYLSDDQNRAVFQYVFMRLQGKTYLKLGTKDPLPGMSWFLFDQKNEDRRRWARENWKNIETGLMTEEQFDWAVSGALIGAMDDISRKDLNSANSGIYLEIERFWQGFEVILRTMGDELILSRLQSLEVRSGCPNIYDLLFRHIQHCFSEGVLVVTIRVLTGFLKKSPKAIWSFLGDARPTVIADIFFASPVYKTLLRQSLEDCWDSPDSGLQSTMFPTSWIAPWLQSLTRDRRYDACEVLMHTLFGTLAKDPAIGEPGQAACVRAGFDALTFTIRSYLDPEVQIVSGSAHLYASAAAGLVVKHMELILTSMSKPVAENGQAGGWTTFKVANAAQDLMISAMKLDMKLLSEEHLAIHNGKQLQSAITRDSKAFWEGILEVFDASPDQVPLAKEILVALAPLVSIEQIRPRKRAPKLDETSQRFNTILTGIADVLARLLGRVSELDAIQLGELYSDLLPFQVTTGLSVHENSDIAEASAEVLKSWTGELSRSGALEQMTQLHPEQTLASIVWTLERVLRPPFPWGPIRPILNMSRDVLRGLADPSSGVLRVKTLDSRAAAAVLRWWNEQWRFVSKACLNIEQWSFYIPNSIMTEFCREIMELAEALIAEDGLFTSATALGKDEKEVMVKILAPAKDNFRGMENMIRLKDHWLVEVTVRVLCKILKRLLETNLEINPGSRKLITDACLPTATPGKYIRTTNLTDQQRAELLQALGQKDEEVQVYQLGKKAQAAEEERVKEKVKKQSKLDAWSKSAPPTAAAASQLRTNRDDVMEMSKSIENPILKQLEARRVAKVKAAAAASKPDQKAISALKESRQREKLEKARRDAEAIARARQLRGEIVQGEGSSLAGLGLLGKDHSRSEIMVNSSDEESESDDESEDGDDHQLAALSNGGLKSLDEAEKRRLQAMRDKVRRPVKKVRQQRSVKEMRARLIPPMDRLHNTILAWDIFHAGNEPPSGPAASSVATRYNDPMSYRETFFPLLASEAWRSFVTSKDEATNPSFGMKIASRASVDSFLEVTYTMPAAQNRERGVFEGDILLVSEAESPLLEPAARHCLSRVHRTTFKKEVIEITYRVASRGNPLASALTPGNTVYGVKITNMATIEREYAALESLQYYDLMDEILRAEPSPILRYGEERVSNYMGNWALNRGQSLAVLGALENDGFTLIQGPPGTGKTKTIVAMVGALLSERLAQNPMEGGTSLGVPVRPAGAPLASQARSKKLLVCAPSNAAVDELVLRLKQGVKTTSGKHRDIKVLRLGRSEAINAAVKDVTLDELVKARLEGDTTKEKARMDREKLHEEAAKIKDQIAELRPQLEASRSLNDRTLHASLSRQFDELKRKQMQIGKQIDANKDSGNSIAREMELRRRQVQQEILNSAHVLCATLSGSGHEMFRNLDVEFETVIIDEAAQCVELSALIPLKYGCCKCILVGDPKQLPPTVLSQSAARFGYDQSLFVRMQQNHPKSVHLLDMQYRMHPEISLFPSREFYESQLQDGQDMLQLRQAPWHQDVLFSPYRFFDVQGVQEKGRKGQSLVNTRELEVALQMYERFRREYGSCDLRGKIGIITPYKAQLHELKSRFSTRYGEDITDNIEFNTTDAFQGRECEIIIFSCVRASSTGGIGFMTDIRRMNVGLTRAKSSLWILGDSRALVQGEFWRKLIEDAQARDRYTQGDILSMFRGTLERAKAGTYAAATPVKPAAAAAVMMDVSRDSSRPSSSAGDAHSDARTDSGSPFAIPGLGSSSSVDPVPRSDGPPVIHTNERNSAGDFNKRPNEGWDSNHGPAKRVAADKAWNGGGLSGKFSQRPKQQQQQQPPKPQDPSAMSLLGLVPPERPPPIPDPRGMGGPMPGPSNGSSSNSSERQKGPPMPPRKKKKPNPFIQKRR